MMDFIKIIAAIALIYFAIASTVWEIRNPTANRIQPILHPISVITFEKRKEFQGN